MKNGYNLKKAIQDNDLPDVSSLCVGMTKEQINYLRFYIDTFEDIYGCNYVCENVDLNTFKPVDYNNNNGNVDLCEAYLNFGNIKEIHFLNGKFYAVSYETQDRKCFLDEEFHAAIFDLSMDIGHVKTEMNKYGNWSTSFVKYLSYLDLIECDDLYSYDDLTSSDIDELYEASGMNTPICFELNFGLVHVMTPDTSIDEMIKDGLSLDETRTLREMQTDFFTEEETLCFEIFYKYRKSILNTEK